MVEKYYNEKNELGVLISSGYGAGWSTWNEEEIAYDKRIIEMWLKGATSSEMCNYIESLGYRKPYMGGYYNLSLKFVPHGTLFCIQEYDGAESIETIETMGMIMA
jgi:hypothetical protein